MNELIFIIFLYFLIGWVLGSVKLFYHLLDETTDIDLTDLVNILVIAVFWLPLLLALLFDFVCFLFGGIIDFFKKNMAQEINIDKKQDENIRN